MEMEAAGPDPAEFSATTSQRTFEPGSKPQTET